MNQLLKVKLKNIKMDFEDKEGILIKTLFKLTSF